jgi:hypothetical protein
MEGFARPAGIVHWMMKMKAIYVQRFDANVDVLATNAIVDP